MSGKGDKQIKAQVPWKQYSDNWDKAFYSKDKKTSNGKKVKSK